jgi:DMSO/TMAO reductase YedYZ molybdopterin-dependent catalytic subunit
MTAALLKLDGDVRSPRALSFADLAALDPRWQIADVRQLNPKRTGGAVRFAGLIDLVGPNSGVRYVTLHAAADDFHASIPLEAVRDTAVLIYQLDGAPLPASAGGPLRFFIPNHTACHTSEIDECANVKFVDRIEFSAAKGHDNRPHDADQHATLHEQQDH